MALVEDLLAVGAHAAQHQEGDGKTIAQAGVRLHGEPHQAQGGLQRGDGRGGHRVGSMGVVS
ncbi:hypothetical protein D3C84_748740 [compost metagenome]